MAPRPDGISSALAMPVLVAALFVTTALPAEDWSTFRGSSRRSGSADGSELPRTLEPLWTFDGKGFSSPDLSSSPAIVQGKVYLGLSESSVFSPGGRVIALDLQTGKLLWQRKTRFPVFSSPSVAGGRVLVGEGYHQDSGCRLYCLDAASGEERWTFETRSHIESGPHLEKDRVYFGAGDDGVYAIGLEDGKAVWHFPGQHVDVCPLVASGLVFAGSGYGELFAFCLAASDGKLQWKTPLDLPVWGSPVLIGNRIVFGLGNGSFTQSADQPRGAVVCLAATSGKQVWRRDLPDAVLTAIASSGERLFTGCRDGNLYAIDLRSGEVLWKRSLGGPVVASPLVALREVAAVSIPGTLVVFSSDAGDELARFNLSKLAGARGKELAVYASPAGAAGKIFAAAGAAGIVALGSPAAK